MRDTPDHIRPTHRDNQPRLTLSSLALVLAVVAGVVARLASASIGDNYDMESWWIASEAFRAGQPIYTATHRYNYGPVWFGIIGGLRELSASTGPDTVHRLHLFLTGFLSLVDFALAAIVFRAVSPMMGVAFFLNPISLAVTGYHIQFDNFAILTGLLGWISFTSPSKSTRHVFITGLCFGLSLSIKHVFSLFLGWLPFLTGVRSLRERLIFGGTALVTFLLSFTPWIAAPAAWQGIRANVFGYLSTEGHSLTSDLASLLPGVAARSIFMTLLTAVGALLYYREALHMKAPLIYLVALTALSSGMARNYLAIPLVALFLLPRVIWSLLYLAIASVIFITVNPALGTSEVADHLLSSPYITYELAQALLLCATLRFATKTRA